MKALLISKIDREDGWVNDGLVCPVENCDTYQEAIDYLLSDEDRKNSIVNHFLSNRGLIDSLFEYEEPYPPYKVIFVGYSGYKFQIEVELTNEEDQDRFADQELILSFSLDFVDILDK